MTSIRPALCLSLPLIIALIFAGCSSASSSSGDLDTRAGCALVTATPTMVGSQVVMDVRAMGCRDPDGRLSSRDDAVDRLSQAVWNSLRLPVDAVHIRVLQSAEAHDDIATIMSSEGLEPHFGPGPSGVVWPPLERGPSDRIWFLLPIAYVVTGIAMVWLVRRLARAGVVLFFFRS